MNGLRAPVSDITTSMRAFAIANTGSDAGRPQGLTTEPSPLTGTFVPDRRRTSARSRRQQYVEDMPLYWVMPAVALVSCIIIGIGFVIGVPGNKD